MNTKGPIPTPPDLEAIRRLHYPCCTVVTAGCQCMACVEPWPCSLSLVFALVDEQARRIEQMQRTFGYLYTIFSEPPDVIAAKLGESRCTNDTNRCNYALELVADFVEHES